jgi:hypothetical protein
LDDGPDPGAVHPGRTGRVRKGLQRWGEIVVRLIRTISLLAVWPCVLTVALLKVISAVSMIFIVQIKGVWK